MLYDKKNNTHPLRRLTGFFDNKILLIIILITVSYTHLRAHETS